MTNGARRSEVWITGVGTLGATGAGWSPFVESYGSGERPLSELDSTDELRPGGDPRRALLVPQDSMKGWISPVQARRLSRPSKYAVCATRMALQDAGLDGLEDDDPAWQRTAVCLGYAWGSTAYSRRLLQQIEDEPGEPISPVLFMETVAIAPAAQVALAHGVKGPSLTLTQREASDLAAVARGAALVASGRVERVLAGVTGEVSEVLHAILSGFRALSPRDRARPFDVRRDGVVAAEGSTIFVLESPAAARARGARACARITGWGRANDPSASPTDWGGGVEPLAAGLASTLRRAGLAPGDVDRVVSGGGGTRRGDALEARVLRAAFGDALPPVSAPKAIVGEYGGGYLAALLHALTRDGAPAAIATESPDESLGVRSSGGDALPRARRVLTSALASGGAATWLAVERG